MLSSRLSSYAGVSTRGWLKTTVQNVEQVRHKTVRFNKPRRAEWFRQNLLAVSKPRWLEDEPIEDIWKNCQHDQIVKEKQEWNDHINQLEEFYVREMVENFERSKMIAFFHANPMKRNKMRIAWQNGRRVGFELKEYHHRVGKAGLKGTQWENCLHFWFQFPGEMNLQPVLFSPQVEPAKLLKFEKKVPEFTLIGCVVENRILSKKQVQNLVNMPSLEESRGELVAVLGHHQQRTLQLLQANQQQLSTNLAQIIKDAESGKT